MEERRQDCIEHKERTGALEKAVWKGNGKPSLSDRMGRLEVMMAIVIMLILGNGGLMAYTLKLISEVTK